MKPNFVIRSATSWMREFLSSSRSIFRYPNTMGYWNQKRARAFSILGRWASVDYGRYDPTIGFRDVHVTNSQLTTFGMCKCVDSRLHIVGRSHKTRSTPPCALLEIAGRDGEQTMPY